VIEELRKSKDLQVRSCSVRLPFGIKIIRPVQQLYPLELNEIQDQTRAEIEETQASDSLRPPATNDDDYDIVSITMEEINDDTENQSDSLHPTATNDDDYDIVSITMEEIDDHTENQSSSANNS